MQRYRTMFARVCCVLLVWAPLLYVNCAKSVFSENENENDDMDEIDASKCSEEYENCGVQYLAINVTDSMIVNATTNEQYDDTVQKSVKVHGFCCPGLVCKHEGYEEEPLAPGITHWCADPDNDLNLERVFNEWKKSLEMPPDYS